MSTIETDTLEIGTDNYLVLKNVGLGSNDTNQTEIFLNREKVLLLLIELTKFLGITLNINIDPATLNTIIQPPKKTDGK